MQIATLSYRYNPRENVNGDHQAKLRHRQILTTITNPEKKHKQRRSLFTDLSAHSNVPLPPIKTNGKRPSSIRIKGSGIASSKLGDSSAYSLPHQSRSHSRQSNRSILSGARSRSASPGGTTRPASKLTRLKFGYPIKLRSADFYGSGKSDSELRFREESFVNDSVRSAHQSRRSSIIPSYEPLDDPHLRQFFQSPIVLDIVRKTLNIDANNSYKQNERLSKPFKYKNYSKIKDSDDHLNEDYHRLVTKGSSGYGKLNGYDCIPTYAPARHYRHRSSTVESTQSSSKRWNIVESDLHRSTAQTKHHASANTSVTSFPTSNSNRLEQQKKKKSHKYEKSKQPKPIATSSPLRHPSRHMIEQITANAELLSTTKTNGNVPEHKSEITVHSNLSQDEH
ncbi:unnamed protein product [Rotaria sordida]|uniref:Uncharacterized protein n=1 Tax=Rotaria sordida TaxID=392033 RepID=A0A813WZJ4_9BILA|nr:unnamed protein product [Rotaria sordida]